jgi:hypothetical protein
MQARCKHHQQEVDAFIIHASSAWFRFGFVLVPIEENIAFSSITLETGNFNLSRSKLFQSHENA